MLPSPELRQNLHTMSHQPSPAVNSQVETNANGNRKMPQNASVESDMSQTEISRGISMLQVESASRRFRVIFSPMQSLVSKETQEGHGPIAVQLKG